ncbi:MAG: hypothetical protein QF629_01605 [Alphaproteobacteria bacterium]|jgi:hypothetical protein|nr:hypothetical protein [Alphaproteobacteria bacterium]MDP7233676.1 hypothetical protein [Alphaproteobacteria bacterium]
MPGPSKPRTPPPPELVSDLDDGNLKDLGLSMDHRKFVLKAATSLARHWQFQGKTREARDLLAQVYGWFTEGFDTPDLVNAKPLLHELATA